MLCVLCVLVQRSASRGGRVRGDFSHNQSISVSLSDPRTPCGPLSKTKKNLFIWLLFLLWLSRLLLFCNSFCIASGLFRTVLYRHHMWRVSCMPTHSRRGCQHATQPAKTTLTSESIDDTVLVPLRAWIFPNTHPKERLSQYCMFWKKLFKKINLFSD